MEIFPLPGIPEIKEGDNVADIILKSAYQNAITFEDGDILVIAQKIISKAEGRVYNKDSVKVTPFAEQMSNYSGHDPEYIELVLQNSRRIVRMANGLVISQTHHGFVMANAGVDSSNSGGKGRIVVLPEDPDRSARLIKRSLESSTGKKVAVIISDTFGRPWRNGQVNMATQIAVADELASAAELVSGKTKKLPVVIIRNYPFDPAPGEGKDLIRDEVYDIFK